MDVLCTNVGELVTSLKGLLEAGINQQDNSVLYHRNAMQEYAFFMSWISALAEADSCKGAREQRQAEAEQGADADDRLSLT